MPRQAIGIRISPLALLSEITRLTAKGPDPKSAGRKNRGLLAFFWGVSSRRDVCYAKGVGCGGPQPALFASSSSADSPTFSCPSHGENRGASPLGSASVFNNLSADRLGQFPSYGNCTARMLPDEGVRAPAEACPGQIVATVARGRRSAGRWFASANIWRRRCGSSRWASKGLD